MGESPLDPWFSWQVAYRAACGALAARLSDDADASEHLEQLERLTAIEPPRPPMLDRLIITPAPGMPELKTIPASRQFDSHPETLEAPAGGRRLRRARGWGKI